MIIYLFILFILYYLFGLKSRGRIVYGLWQYVLYYLKNNSLQIN